jgi:hypothetical protein
MWTFFGVVGGALIGKSVSRLGPVERIAIVRPFAVDFLGAQRKRFGTFFKPRSPLLGSRAGAATGPFDNAFFRIDPVQTARGGPADVVQTPAATRVEAHSAGPGRQGSQRATPSATHFQKWRSVRRPSRPAVGNRMRLRVEKIRVRHGEECLGRWPRRA